MSAVVGVITLFVVSLTGVVLETLGFTVLRSELDHLYYCGTWCVCFGFCVVSLLLSAVHVMVHFIVVYGFGVATMTLVLLLPQSELDYLI